jgi:hypothetical protein
MIQRAERKLQRLQSASWGWRVRVRPRFEAYGRLRMSVSTLHQIGGRAVLTIEIVVGENRDIRAYRFCIWTGTGGHTDSSTQSRHEKRECEHPRHLIR